MPRSLLYAAFDLLSAAIKSDSQKSESCGTLVIIEQLRVRLNKIESRRDAEHLEIIINIHGVHYVHHMSVHDKKYWV